MGRGGDRGSLPALRLPLRRRLRPELDRHPRRHQRLDERQVEVDRPRPWLQRPLHRLFREHVPGPRGFGARSRKGRVERPADVAAEDAHLVDGLVGSGAAEHGGPIGREQEQGHPGHRCLDHRRQPVRHRGPRGADQGDRPVGGASQSEREEAAGALVEVDVDPDASVPGEGEGDRGGARPRGDAGVPKAEAVELTG